MRLQTKLLIFLASMAFLVGGLILFLSHRSVHTILVEEVAKRGLLKTKDLPTEAGSGFQTQSETAILPILQASLEQTGAIYAMALDPKGRVLAHTNVVETGKTYTDPATREALRSDQPGYREWEVDGQTVVDVSLPVWSTRQATTEEEFLLFGGKELKETTRLGTLRLGLPFHETLQTESRITTQIMWIMIIIGMIALGIFLIFTRKILRRVRLLIEGTEKISRGEYGALVPVLSEDELGVLTQSFNRMSEDLAQAHGHLENEVKLRTQELESVIYTMSHDLKSPVVSMQGMASILMEDYSNQFDEKGKHYVQRIIANANYMEQMIMDLLALSRIGRAHKAPEPVEVRSVIEKILDLNQERFSQKGIEIVVDPSLPHFHYDRTQATEIFQNLITNAAKFMGDQPRPRIEIGGRESGEWIEFYVKDNGIGIDPEYHDKIFGVFQRLKDVEVEGTGVGLCIVKKIVDLAGGKIWIESRRGEGATFFVRFPKTEKAKG
jgi:signal transduction histidine kinase